MRSSLLWYLSTLSSWWMSRKSSKAEPMPTPRPSTFKRVNSFWRRRDRKSLFMLQGFYRVGHGGLPGLYGNGDEGAAKGQGEGAGKRQPGQTIPVGKALEPLTAQYP